MARPRNPNPITWAEKDKIRRIIGLPASATWPRCPARDERIVKKLPPEKRELHQEKGHVCRDCRCKNIAGWQTKGDFYGLGEHTGHYGVGFCSHHERGRRRVHALELAKNHLKDLQRMGEIPPDVHDLTEIVKFEAVEAQKNIELREAFAMIRDNLSEFREKCREPEAQKDRLAEAINRLATEVAKAEFIDPEQAAGIIEILTNIPVGMTETAGGRIIPMTDKTRFEIANKIGLAVSKLSMDRFKMDAASFVHIDDIKTRVYRTLSLVERFIHDKDDLAKFLQEYYDLWKSVGRK